jgi:hypothetical protein
MDQTTISEIPNSGRQLSSKMESRKVKSADPCMKHYSARFGPKSPKNRGTTSLYAALMLTFLNVTTNQLHIAATAEMAIPLDVMDIR